MAKVKNKPDFIPNGAEIVEEKTKKVDDGYYVVENGFVGSKSKMEDLKSNYESVEIPPNEESSNEELIPEEDVNKLLNPQALEEMKRIESLSVEFEPNKKKPINSGWFKKSDDSNNINIVDKSSGLKNNDSNIDNLANVLNRIIEKTVERKLAEILKHIENDIR